MIPLVHLRELMILIIIKLKPLTRELHFCNINFNLNDNLAARSSGDGEVMASPPPPSPVY